MTLTRVRPSVTPCFEEPPGVIRPGGLLHDQIHPAVLRRARTGSTPRGGEHRGDGYGQPTAPEPVGESGEGATGGEDVVDRYNHGTAPHRLRHPGQLPGPGYEG